MLGKATNLARAADGMLGQIGNLPARMLYRQTGDQIINLLPCISRQVHIIFKDQTNICARRHKVLQGLDMAEVAGNLAPVQTAAVAQSRTAIIVDLKIAGG